MPSTFTKSVPVSHVAPGSIQVGTPSGYAMVKSYFAVSSDGFRPSSGEELLAAKT
jgi:hypothetical protein